MIFNAKYNVYATKSGLIYKIMKNGKLKLINGSNLNGYLIYNNYRIHRIIWETYIGEIPDEMEIDHINTIRNDNRLDNLRCITHKENMNNELTINNRRNIMKYNIIAAHKTHSEFGDKFKEHFGINMCDNVKLYKKEWLWYHNHNNKCRWE
jgi:hypothetical protein